MANIAKKKKSGAAGRVGIACVAGSAVASTIGVFLQKIAQNRTNRVDSLGDDYRKGTDKRMSYNWRSVSYWITGLLLCLF